MPKMVSSAPKKRLNWVFSIDCYEETKIKVRKNIKLKAAFREYIKIIPATAQ